MRRSFFTRVSKFGRFRQLLQLMLQPRNVFATATEFGVQTDQGLMHLLKVMLQVGNGHFQPDQAVFSLGIGHGSDIESQGEYRWSHEDYLTARTAMCRVDRREITGPQEPVEPSVTEDDESQAV